MGIDELITGGPSQTTGTMVPSHVFNGTMAPLLHEVHFDNVFFANVSDIQLMRNLTSFDLVRNADEPETSLLVPNLQQLHEVLQNSPQLTDLLIEDYISQVEPRDLATFLQLPVVYLPVLRSFGSGRRDCHTQHPSTSPPLPAYV